MAPLVETMQQRFFPSRNGNMLPEENLGEAPRYEDVVNPDNSRRITWTTPYFTPYLGLRARLSQVWFNRWTLLLFLVLVRVLLATSSLNSDLESARAQALSACTSVESVGSAMASMPHYMAQGVNELAASGIEAAVRGLEETLLLMITGVQEIVVFVVNMLTSTYVCLITLAIKGSLDVVIDATKDITDFVNKTIDTIFDNIQDDIKSVTDALNKVAKSLEAVPNFFGANVDFPDVSIPSADKLKNISIPSDFNDKLDALEKKIPTFDEVQNAADDAIRIPFQKIHDLVNSTLKVYKFDRSVFPVPNKESLTFCSDNNSINDFFDGLAKTAAKTKSILIGVLIVLAILAMIPMAYREWWNWRSTRSRAQMLTGSNRPFDPIDVVQIATRPYSSTVGLKLANKFESPRRQVLVRWAVAYVTSPAALFVLSLGVAGLASVLCQFILLKQVEREAPALASEIGSFADQVVDKLNAASTSWAVKTNAAINSTNKELNDDVFGWVETGTKSLNDTLNTFVDTMHGSINTLFNNTPLAEPINDVLDCLITLKVKGIQKGLTWAHDNAHVTFPTLPNDTFSLGALASVGPDADGTSSFLADTDGQTTDKISEAVVKLTSKWGNALRQEAIISAVVTSIWIIVLLIAIIRTLVFFFGRDKNRGEGGPAPDSNRSGPSTSSMNMHATFGDKQAPPVFPTFTGGTQNSPPYPASPEDEFEYPDEKGIHLGTVNARQSTIIDGGANRESMHPKVYYKY